MDKKKAVKDGYNQIAELYSLRRLSKKQLNYDYFDKIIHHFPAKGKLLDLGCGGGIPVSSYFFERGFGVTGVDISSEMIEISRKNIPAGKFFVSDMLDCKFADEEFDVIVSTFAIIHIPQEEQNILFKKIYNWLKTGGMTYLVLGSQNQKEVTKDNWHGVRMFWSSFSPEEYQKIIKETGFKLLWDEIEEIPDDATFYNVILQK